MDRLYRFIFISKYDKQCKTFIWWLKSNISFDFFQVIELQRQFLSDKHASKCECENNNYPIRNGKVQSAQFHFWGAAVNYYWLQ